MTVATPRRLSLVPAPSPRADDAGRTQDDGAEPPLLTVPVPRAPGSTPWRTQDDVTHVPAVLLLAAAGRCSCEDCCAVLAARLRPRALLPV